MSRESLEIVVRGLEAACAPTPDLKTINEVYAREHVLVTGMGEEAQGLEGYESWSRDTQATSAPELTLEGAVDLGPDLVLAVVGIRIRGSASEMILNQRHWVVVRLSGDKIIRTEAYVSPAEALEAAGLSK